MLQDLGAHLSCLNDLPERKSPHSGEGRLRLVVNREIEPKGGLERLTNAESGGIRPPGIGSFLVTIAHRKPYVQYSGNTHLPSLSL